MAFVNSNHYVVLHFKNVNGSIPAPPIDNDLKLFQKLMPSDASSLSSKKKQSPNWLPSEEEQLAVLWIHVSEQPEFEKKDVVMQPFVSSPPSSEGIKRPESSDPGALTSITTTSSQPIGSKAAKRQHLSNLKLDEDKNIQAQEFNTISKQQLLVIQEGNEILKEKNELQKKQLKIEEEKLIIEKEHHASEVMISRTLTVWKFLS
ncbi:hypothetical protein PPACK8108_LOCUS17991 [Phakopsora pachyrhizi]|uniref:No apical meristem-associated C-terminal domain-containing protein n=1 Tax=Phakopsora pachyrhizi TaxID=170000 RepID=A0AAV0BCR8_PHAPC|nr:hypothetical protein PPACK8108_LOCUS17991 [Phakopsora pachyrhizi]